MRKHKLGDRFIPLSATNVMTLTKKTIPKGSPNKQSTDPMKGTPKQNRHTMMAPQYFRTGTMEFRVVRGGSVKRRLQKSLHVQEEEQVLSISCKQSEGGSFHRNKTLPTNGNHYLRISFVDPLYLSKERDNARCSRGLPKGQVKEDR
jgi:hypothetical protein